MANSRDLVAYVLELLRPLGPVRARAMFGGHGIYVDERMVGPITDDTFYIKTDAETRAQFTAEHLAPFTYSGRDGAVHVTSYYRAPDDAMDNADAMAPWARLGIGASMRKAAQAPRAGAIRAGSGRGARRH